MKESTQQPVAVGVDGTPGSAGALRYAVAEARRRGTSLRLVHVVPAFLTLGPALPLSQMEQTGRLILDQAMETVRHLAPGLEVSAMLSCDDRSDGVVAATKDVQLLAIGRETQRGVERLVTGTATASIAAHARCDVVVVPSYWVDDIHHHRVVVGVKSTHGSRHLLAHAFREAAARDAVLTVVVAWQLADPYFDRIEARTHAKDWEDNGREVILEITADWRTAYPAVATETRIVHGSPARVLLNASSDSDLLVISRRKLAIPPYGRLGGVGHDLLRLSNVPVLVVPFTANPPAEDEPLELEKAGALVK